MLQKSHIERIPLLGLSHARHRTKVRLLACLIGIFVTLPYAMFVGWKGFADVWRNAQPQADPM